MPLYAAYTIILRPLTAQVSIQTLVSDPFPMIETLPGNATIALHLSLEPSFDTGYIPTTETTATLRSGEVITCPEIPPPGYWKIIQCSSSWEYVSSVSISVSLPSGILYVYPGQGTLPVGFDYPEVYTILGGGVPLFPGSHVVGVISWTERQLISALSWGSVSRNTIWTSEVAGLQTKPFGDTPDSNLTTLTLFQPDAFATKFLQDTVDATALSGVATFGGFWTFVNGTFVLFFGANVGGHFLLSVWYTYSNVVRWPANGMKTSRLYTQKGVNPAPNLPASSRSSASALWTWTQGSELEPERRGEYNVRESADEDDTAAFKISAEKSEVESPYRGYLLNEYRF
ncbi:hypothetical protein C8R44DRAFT_987549 [Mycena epipterygia]|nr:hypothetical protein C8R44DRAFT_987549 [Mycena epipterygia]